LLADELGSVREVVSQLLRVFEDKRWVDLAREKIRIIDAAALTALARA
jgi:CRP/FNR family transcriptional regulator